MAKKLSAKQIDKLVERAYYATCSGIQIDILNIGKVFEAGRKAYAEGRDLNVAVREFVETIKEN